MSALMSTFGKEATKGLREASVDSGLDSAPAANDRLYNTQPKKTEFMEVAVRQVAQPDQLSANQPQMDSKQKQAQDQFNSKLSKPIDLGPPKDLGAGAKAGNDRMQDAHKAGQDFTVKAAELLKTASGADNKLSSGPSFARAAAAPAIGMGAALRPSDIAALNILSGRPDKNGPSSFKTADSRGDTGYVSAAPAEPQAGGAAAPISTAFMKKTSGGDLDAGRIDLTSAGLSGIETLKLDTKAFNAQLENSVAFKSLRDGAFKNGLAVARADGEKLEAKDEVLAFKPSLPNPGVMVAAAPKPFFA